MIGERYAVANRPAVTTRPNRGALWRRGSAPAIAGRERLARAIDQSVLTQLVLALGFIAAAGLLYLAQASLASVDQLNIAALQDERTQLTVQNANLHATATSLQSLQRIDVVATTQLHMSKPDLSTAIWINPQIPIVRSPRPITYDMHTAQRASQPLAGMERFLALVKSSL